MLMKGKVHERCDRIARGTLCAEMRSARRGGGEGRRGTSCAASACTLALMPDRRRVRRRAPRDVPPGHDPEESKAFAAGVGDPTGGESTLEQAFEGDPTLADPA